MVRVTGLTSLVVERPSTGAGGEGGEGPQVAGVGEAAVASESVLPPPSPPAHTLQSALDAMKERGLRSP